MSSMGPDAEGGINTLIKEQAQVPGDITVSLYQFDTEYEKVFGPINAKDAPTYNLHPRGMTALLDATNRAIVETGQYLSSKPESERPSKVIFVIVTDGHENASKEVTREQLKSAIKKQQDVYSWEFIFLGANLDAVNEARNYGVANAVQYMNTGASMGGTYKGLSNSISHSRVHNVAVSDTLAGSYTADGAAVENTSAIIKDDDEDTVS